MKSCFLRVLFCLWSSTLTLATLPEEGGELPIHIHRITDEITVFKAGDNPNGPNVTVIESSSGLIIIDTHMAPTIAGSIRECIVKQTGRSDFLYVINTHHHFDHTGGNQIFEDAMIIGTDRCVDAMRQFENEIETFVDRRKQFKSNLEGQLLNTDPGDDEAIWLRERIEYNERMIAEYPSNFRVTPPDLIFKDRLRVILDDMTLILYAFPFAHTASDLLIYVPDLGTVFAGDFLGGIWLSPGREEVVGVWLDCLNEVLNDDSNIEHVIGGHSLNTNPDVLLEDHQFIQQTWDQIRNKKSAVTVGRELFTSSDMQSTLSRLEVLAVGPDPVYFLANQFFEWMTDLMREQKADEAACLYSWMGERFKDWLRKQAWLFNLIDGYIQTLVDLKAVQPAIAFGRTQIEVYPRMISGYSTLAKVYMLEDEPERAEEVLVQALSIDPENAVIHEIMSTLNDARKQE
jgi:glyoxylase-like metal-dependent hydrolase (beta-lactamase superfamily II)